LGGKWTLDCGFESLRQSLREQGFGIPYLHAEAVSGALGTKYTPVHVLAESDAVVAYHMSVVDDVEARRTGKGHPGSPIIQEFYDLESDQKDEVYERLTMQKLDDASQMDLGPETILDKKGLKAYCRTIAKRSGYARPSAALRGTVLLEKRSETKQGLSVGFHLDAGGSHTQYWATKAVYFRFVHDSGASLPAVFLNFPGFFYNSAKPSTREVERLRSIERQSGPVWSLKALKAYYAMHPRTPEEISDELKLSVAAWFAFTTLLLEHLDFEPAETADAMHET